MTKAQVRTPPDRGVSLGFGHWAFAGHQLLSVGHASRLCSDHFCDLYAKPVLDHDDFAKRDLLLVYVEVDRSVGDLVELDDRASVELENVPHRHLTGAEF